MCDDYSMPLKVTRNLQTVEHVALPSGIYVERSSEITLDDHPEDGFTLRMKVAYDDALGRLVSREVTVASNDGHEVTGTTLRAVRVQEVLQQAGLLLLTKRSEGDHGAEIRAGDILRSYSAEPDSYRKSPEAAANIYEVSLVLNFPPLKTISDILGVSQSTATRLVSKARDMGLLRSGNG